MVNLLKIIYLFYDQPYAEPLQLNKSTKQIALQYNSLTTPLLTSASDRVAPLAIGSFPDTRPAGRQNVAGIQLRLYVF